MGATQRAEGRVESADEKKKSETLKAESAGRTGTREEELRGIIEKMTAKTWKRDKSRLLELLAPVKGEAS